MIRRVAISGFKKFPVLEFELQERALIAGPNNSGKTTLLQALATWSDLGEIWLARNSESAREDILGAHRVEVDVSTLKSLALYSFDELWHNQDTRKPISIRAATDLWDIGFDLQYQDASTATVGRLSTVSDDDLKAYAKNRLKALYIPSLSGLDVREPEYGESVISTRLAHGKAGMVLRNLIQAASRNDEKWRKLQSSVKSLFGFELAMPSGADPIMVRYRHSEKDHWYDLVNGAAGFLQTLLIQSALLHTDAALFLVDEPDAHLHALLKERIYRIIREHCEENECQAIIATHSGRLIEEAASEQGGKLFLVASNGLKPVRRSEALELLRVPSEQIVLAETTKRVLYLEGRSDLDMLIAWATVLDHPSVQCLQNALFLPTAEEGRRNFAQRNFRALKAQVPTLKAVEIRDRNGSESEKWLGLRAGELRIEEGTRRMPEGMALGFWSRYEIENYLIHPVALLRFVLRRAGKKGEAKAKKHMENYFPPILFKEPLESTLADLDKGKRAVAAVLTSAGIDLGESRYHELAGSMMPEEVHPDVVAMLNKIAEQFAGDEM
ncbi:MAG: AAA family ATPase [Roseovarius sp.]|nr:AAA family ATPase [Roseovarius sp.]